MPKIPTIRSRQRGTVAIMAGLAAVTLFAFGGLALDLGHLYIAKSELQNAADAAALAGAKELNNKLEGVTRAVNKAIAIAAQHRYDFSKPVTITIDNIRLASCPNAANTNTFGRPTSRTPTCTFVPAASVTSDAEAPGLSFIEVDSGTQNLNTYLMRVAGAAYNTTSTAGYAVAGRFFTNVTPIGVCAISTQRTDSYALPGPPATTEVLQYGFRFGMAYDVMSLGPLSGAGVPYLVNPVDTDPASCDPYHSSTNFTAPFVCTGTSAVAQGLSAGTGNAIGNTGLSDSIVKALNSRFGKYSGAYGTNKCDPSSAPPDANIMQYCYTTSGGSACPNQAPRIGAQGTDNNDPDAVANWSDNTNTHQTVAIDATTKKPLYNYAPGGTGTPNLAFGTNPAGPNNGVLWSYGPAYQYDSSKATGVGTAFTAAEANAQSQMYNTGTAMRYFGDSYPASYPYWQTSGPMFSSGGPTGVRNRRVLNLLIIDCDNVVGTGACGRQLPVLGIGKFFMQTLADPTGSPKKIYGEFAGLVAPIPSDDIKLFR
jgi:Flp pilus assembly protein TadG